jgi:RNA polymerase sigma-B factor
MIEGVGRSDRELAMTEASTTTAPTAQDLRALHEAYRATGDPAARDEIIARHLPLARQMASAFAGRGEPFDDLHQVARLALVRALDRYDVDRGPFAAYASRFMAGALKRHFRDRTWMVRPPRRTHDLALATSDARDDLRATLRREPTTDELARVLGVPFTDAADARAALASYRRVALDAPSRRVGQTVADALGDEDPAYSEAESRIDRERTVATLLAALAPDVRRVIELYFLEGMRQREIAVATGTSQVHVSRQITRALSTMRAHAAWSPERQRLRQAS